MPSISKTEAIEKIRHLISVSYGLNDAHDKSSSPSFKQWHRDVRVVIAHIFGEGSTQLRDFKDISFTLGTFIVGTPDSEFMKAYNRGLETARAILNSIIGEINDFWSNKTRKKENKGLLAFLQKCVMTWRNLDKYLKAAFTTGIFMIISAIIYISPSFIVTNEQPVISTKAAGLKDSTLIQNLLDSSSAQSPTNHSSGGLKDQETVKDDEIVVIIGSSVKEVYNDLIDQIDSYKSNLPSTAYNYLRSYLNSKKEEIADNLENNYYIIKYSKNYEDIGDSRCATIRYLLKGILIDKVNNIENEVDIRLREGSFFHDDAIELFTRRFRDELSFWSEKEPSHDK